MIEVRAATDADRPALLEFMQQAAGADKARTLDRRWHWQWRADPRLDEPGYKGVVATWRGRILANVACIPAGLHIAGHPVEAVWLVDVRVHRGPARDALRACLREGMHKRDRFPNGLAAALFSHPSAGKIQLGKHIGEDMMSIGRRIGFQDVPGAANWMRRVSLRWPLQKAIGRRPGAALAALADLGARQDRPDERGQRRQWFLLSGFRPRLDPERLDIAALRPHYPPSDQFWADPFIWTQNGQACCFFEARAYRIKRGHIRAWPLDTDGQPVGESFPVIDRPHHLSYPFTFEHQGEIYMIPESAETQRLELYGCVRFPDRWELIRPLLEGQPLSDCSLLHHDSRWWLFCAGRRGRRRVNETLLAFHAKDPLSLQ